MDGGNSLDFQLELNALEDYIRYSTFEESFLREKSRIKWMKKGDRNSQFFHRTIKVHTAKNKILRLQDDNGIWTKNYEEVKDLAIGFFSNLFSETNTTNLPQLQWSGH